MSTSSRCFKLAALGLIALLALLIPAQAQLKLLEITHRSITPDKELYDINETVTVVIEARNLGKGLKDYKLSLYTGLEQVRWTVITDGRSLSSLARDWSLAITKYVERISITLVGITPDWEYVFEVPFITIKQEELKDYLLYLDRTVARPEARAVAGTISAAKLDIQRAQDAIDAAHARGLDVSRAKEKLRLAQSFVSEAESLAKKGQLDQAELRARDASSLASEAHDLAKHALGGAEIFQAIATWVPICVAILVVILVLFFRFRRWERL